MRTKETCGAQFVFGLVCATLPHASTNAYASQHDVQLHWIASDPTCPSETEVRAALERELGPSASALGWQIYIKAEVSPTPEGGWNLLMNIGTDDQSNERRLSGGSCAELADAAVSFTALAIYQAFEGPQIIPEGDNEPQPVEIQAFELPVTEVDPSEAPAPEPGGEAESVSDRDATAMEPPGPTKRKVRARAPDPSIRAQVGIAYGDLPGTGPLVRFGVGLRWTHLRIELDGQYNIVQRVRLEQFGGEIQQVAGIVRGCGVIHARRAKLEFPLCAGIEAGVQIGVGVGFTMPERGTGGLVNIDLGAAMVWIPHPRVAIGVGAEPRFAVLSTIFSTGSAERTIIWQAHDVGIRGALSAEARF